MCEIWTTYAHWSQIGHQSSCVKKSKTSQPSENWRGSGGTFFTQLLLHFGRFEKLSIYLVNLLIGVGLKIKPFSPSLPQELRPWKYELHFNESRNGSVPFPKEQKDFWNESAVSAKQQNSRNFIEELESVKLALEQIVCNLPNYDWCFQSIFLNGKVPNGHAMPCFFQRSIELAWIFCQ